MMFCMFNFGSKWSKIYCTKIQLGFYFLGLNIHEYLSIFFQDDFLLHLDPHLSQDKVDLTPEDFNLDSYHSKNPRKLHISKMDPR